MLITGGRYSGAYSEYGDAQTLAEVILPSGRSCIMPHLPSPGRFSHHQASYNRQFECSMFRLALLQLLMHALHLFS